MTHPLRPLSYLLGPPANFLSTRGLQALAAAGLVATLAACGGASASQSTGSTGAPVQISPTQAPSFGAPVASISVNIKNFAFSPAAISVQAGTEVTWTNQDADAHTVTFDGDGSGSPAFQNGEIFKRSFSAAGTFKYHCSLHPYMQGEVVVTTT